MDTPSFTPPPPNSKRNSSASLAPSLARIVLTEVPSVIAYETARLYGGQVKSQNWRRQLLRARRRFRCEGVGRVREAACLAALTIAPCTCPFPENMPDIDRRSRL